MEEYKIKHEKLIHICSICGRIKVLKLFLFSKKIESTNISRTACPDCFSDEIEGEINEI
jgi:hypothetical protein